MRNLLRSIFLTMIVFYLTVRFVGGFSYSGDLEVLVVSAAAYQLLDTFLKPILKLVLFPLHFITLGLLRWLTDVLVLYLTVVLVPGLSINGYDFPGLSMAGVTIEPRALSALAVYVFTLIVIRVLSRIVNWIVD